MSLWKELQSSAATTRISLPKNKVVNWNAGERVLEELNPTQYAVLKALHQPDFNPSSTRIYLTNDEIIESAKITLDCATEGDYLDVAREQAVADWKAFRKTIQDIDSSKEATLFKSHGALPSKEVKDTVMEYVLHQPADDTEALYILHASGALKAAGFDNTISPAFANAVVTVIATLSPEIEM